MARPKPTKERILRAAVDIVRRRGVDALTIRGVADRLTLTPMAVYKHFDDKAQLVDAVVWNGFERWEAYIARALEQAAPAARVWMAVQQYREFALDEPRLFELMFMTPRPGVPHISSSVTFTERPVFGAVVMTIAVLHQEGVLAGAPDTTMVALWALIQGLMVLYSSGRFGDDRRGFTLAFDAVIAQTFPALAPR